MWSRRGAGFRRGTLLLGLALGLTAVTGRARAQSVPVEIQADRPGLSIALANWDTGAPMACGEHCALNLPPGEYRLDLAADGRVVSRKLVVRRPSHVTVAPPDESARDRGEILKETGGMLVLLGSGMLFYSFFHHLALSYGCSGSCDEHAWVAYVGASLFVGGAALGIAGKVIESSNSKPRLQVTHPSAPGEGSASLRMSPVVGPRWTGLALTGSF